MSVILDANSAAFNSKLAQAQARLSSFEKTVIGLGNTIAASFGAYAAFNGLKAGLSIIIEFEAQMSALKAITDATPAEFDKLRDSALQLGAATKFTATQVGVLQTEFARLGFSTSEILNATKATILLATATGEDLAKSTVVVGSAIRQFNLPAQEANHIADVMAGAFNKTALALDDFGEAMKYVGPAAAAAGLSFEQTSALLGVLADSGIKGSQAGTSLRRILTDLAKDGRPLSEKLKELASRGISLQNSFDDIGRVASTSLLVLEKGVSRIDPLTKTFENLTGETARVAAEMQDNLQGDITRLTAAFNNLILSSSGVAPALRPIAQGLTDIFASLTSEKISLLQKFAALSGAIATGGGSLLLNANDLDRQLKFESDSDKAARVKFLTYAKGYKTTTEAAKVYVDVQKSLLQSEQRQVEENNKLFSSAEDQETINKRLNESIAKRLRMIKIASEYVRAVAPPTDDTEIGKLVVNIPFLEGEIKKLKDAQLKDSIEGTTIWEEYDKQIQKLESRIARIKGELKDIPIPDKLLELSPINKKFKPAGINQTKETQDFFSQESTDAQLKAFRDKIEAAKKLGNTMKDLSLRFANASSALVQFGEQQKGVYNITVNFTKLIADVATKTVVGFADALGQAFAGENTKDIGKTFLQGIVSFLHDFGVLLIQAGIAKLAFIALLQDPTPVGAAAAIAAGIALVALTSAISSSFKSQSKTASSATSSAGRNTSTGSEGITINGQFVARGSDLFVVLQNYNANKNG